MITQCLECFVSVLGRCVAILFSLPITADVSLGSLLAAGAILGSVISVVLAGLRAYSTLYTSSGRQDDVGQSVAEGRSNHG